MSYAIVYLPLKPEVAKSQNLPLKLPVLAQDIPVIEQQNTIPLDIILRGLRAQWKAKKDAYYGSYLRYFIFEQFKMALRDNAFDEASQLLEESLECKSDDYLYYFYSGLLFKKTGEFGKAETNLRQSAALNLVNPMLTFELGQLLFELDDLDNALEQFTQTLERDRQFTPAYVACGDIFHRIGDYTRAMDCYKKAVEIAPSFIPPYIRLGVIYNNKQQFEKARESFEKGLKRDPQNFELHYNIAFTYMRLKKPLLSLDHLKQCIQIDAKRVNVYNEMGILYKNLGYFDAALSILLEGLKIEDALTLKWHLMQVYAFKGQFTKAQALLREIGTGDHSLEMTQLDRELDHELTNTVENFSLMSFSAYVLDAYEDISDPLKGRLVDLTRGMMPETDLSQPFNPELLPLAIDILQAYEGFSFSLFRALCSFSADICHSLDWLVFSRFLFVLNTDSFVFFDEHSDPNEWMERIADEIIDLDWSLANQLVQTGRESFMDMEELLERSQSQPEQSQNLDLSGLILLVLNVLWIEPTEEERLTFLKVYHQFEPINELCSFYLNKKKAFFRGE
ncbi:MAG TPA: tetratricopeptide repeat protein [Thermotogota bacterium]|nr:tetratricopeptide repeat protein [Thermotogota bacterium]